MKSESKQPTILILTPFFSPNVGGVETRFDNITDYLDRRGYRVWVLTYQPIVTRGVRGPRVEDRGERTRIWRMRWPGGDLFHRLLNHPFLCLLYLCPGLFCRAFWLLLCRRREIDVIHAPGFASALVARLLKILFGMPYIVTVHALYGFANGSVGQKTARWILGGARKVMALSGQSESDMLNVGLRPEQVGIHVNWVDTNRFRPMDKDACRLKFGIGGGFVVVMVGRLMRIKGVGMLLEMVRAMRGYDVTFVVAGDGEMSGAVAEAARESGGRLVFFGRRGNDELPEIYGTGDVSLVPSIYPEGFSRVVLESLCCGLPVVGSNMGCIPEQVDSSCSILAAPTMVNFREAILTLKSDPERLVAMSRAARALGAVMYSEKNMDSLIAAYGVCGTGDSVQGERLL